MPGDLTPVHADGIERTDLGSLLLHHTAGPRHNDQNSDRQEYDHEYIGEALMLCQFCSKALYSVDRMLIDHDCIIAANRLRDLCLLLQNRGTFLRPQDQLCVGQHIEQLRFIHSFSEGAQNGIRQIPHGQGRLHDQPLGSLQQVLIVIQMLLDLLCADLACLDHMDHELPNRESFIIHIDITDILIVRVNIR